MENFSHINAKAYDALFEIRDILFKNFEKNQKNAADHILALFDKHIDNDNIETLVDIGCGTGEILMLLEEKYGSSIGSYIGVDVSSKQIEFAVSNAKKKRSACNFICCALEELEDNFAFATINWSKTVLLCTGHTLPHFDQYLFQNFLKKHCPKYLFVDFYNNFDETLDNLLEPENECIVEPRTVVKSTSYALVTKTDPKADDRILRGIEKFSYGGGSEPVGITNQSRDKSSCHICRIKELGYLLEKSEEYTSAYGPIISYLFIIPDSRAKGINEIYYKTVSSFVRQICKKEHILGVSRYSSSSSSVTF